MKPNRQLVPTGPKRVDSSPLGFTLTNIYLHKNLPFSSTQKVFLSLRLYRADYSFPTAFTHRPYAQNSYGNEQKELFFLSYQRRYRELFVPNGNKIPTSTTREVSTGNSPSATNTTTVIESHIHVRAIIAEMKLPPELL